MVLNIQSISLAALGDPAKYCVLFLPMLDGKYADYSGRSRTITKSGTFGTSVLTKDGSYVQTGASSAYYLTDSSTDFAMGTGDFTMGCWFKSPSNGVTNWFISNYTTYAELDLTFNTNSLTFYTNGGAAPSIAVAWTPDTLWHFYVLKRSSGTCYLYKDNVLLGSSATAFDMGSSARQMSIYNSNNNYYMKGRLRYAFIFKGHALSTSELLTLYNVTYIV